MNVKHEVPGMIRPIRSISAPLLAILLAFAAWGGGPPLVAQSAAPLSSLRAIQNLSKGKVQDGLPVAFEATVAYYDPRGADLIVHDGSNVIHVGSQPGLDLHAGDRVFLKGKTRKGIKLDVADDTVSVVRRAALPVPVPADIERLMHSELPQPAILSAKNLKICAILLFTLLLAASGRAWIIEKKVRHQNAKLAYVERSRARILEEINGAKPLDEMLGEITRLMTLSMPDALCWCEIGDGAVFGKNPTRPDKYRIVKEAIAARSGPPLGTIYAAFPPSRIRRAGERENLSRSGALASLAIETRRLYSDLVRRSDFDMLTDVHNRFSLDRRLDELIDRSREKPATFGLLYLDLDGFKQVNDLYGHKAGDLYLQQVAARIKHQLRTRDMLARIGGDEFAVLLPNVRSRGEVEEIARRVGGCIDCTFDVGGFRIIGSASVGTAIYPEDGETKDAILTGADAAMYAHKQLRQLRRA